MSIRVFAHDANPGVDRHLCTKSREEVVEMIRCGSVHVLRNARGKEWAVQFVRIVERTLASQLSAFLAAVPDVGAGGETAEQLLDLFQSSAAESSTAIDDGEMRANAGVVDAQISPIEILRAQLKVRAWPHVGDDRAVRVGVKHAAEPTRAQA
jgi:hypothetical protein